MVCDDLGNVLVFDLRKSMGERQDLTPGHFQVHKVNIY